MVVLSEKGQAESLLSKKHKPRLPKYAYKNYTVGEVRHKKESKSENKLGISIILLLAAHQQPYWRAMSDIYVQLVYQLTTAKAILPNSDHIYVSTGYTSNVKGSSYFSTTLGKICYAFHT